MWLEFKCIKLFAKSGTNIRDLGACITNTLSTFGFVGRRFLVLLAIMGVITTGMRGTQSDRMVVTSVSMSVEALLGDCPKWLPWCVV